MINGWKIRLMNWSSPADKIYLTLDTLLDSNQQALLTNGIYEYPVQTTLLNGQTRLAIPITVLDTPEDLYLAVATTTVAAGTSYSGCSQVSVWVAGVISVTKIQLNVVIPTPHNNFSWSSNVKS